MCELRCRASWGLDYVDYLEPQRDTLPELAGGTLLLPVRLHLDAKDSLLAFAHTLRFCDRAVSPIHSSFGQTVWHRTASETVTTHDKNFARPNNGAAGITKSLIFSVDVINPGW